MYFLPVLVLTVIASMLNDGLVPAQHAEEAVEDCQASKDQGLSPVGHPSGWDLVFNDEFEGTQLDPRKWTTCYWWGVGGCTNASNNELEWYQPDDVVVGDGILRLQARRRGISSPDGKSYSYTSGMVTSGRDAADTDAPSRFAFQYGYAEIRAKVPAGRGLWPAFWLLPDTHDSMPEIDVMEVLGHDTTTVHMNLHYLRANGSRGRSDNEWSGPDFSACWHTFAVDWRPNGITWFVDGAPIASDDVTAHVPASPMYLLVNLAVGGDWPRAPDSSTPFPSNFDIDYVRVWRPSLSILPGDVWRYRSGLSEPPTDWSTPSFDDSTWSTGPSGFGYADEDDATVLSDMRHNYGTVYLRRIFGVAAPRRVTGLTLAVDYDDGFVAYLNGVEVARANVEGPKPAHTVPAVEHEASGGCRCTTTKVFDLAAVRHLLVPGNNVLAVQGHNTSVDSSDFSLTPTLIAVEEPAPPEPPSVPASAQDQACDWGPEGILPKRPVLAQAGGRQDA